MKDSTKRTLKTTFLSLIKNDAAIEGAKTAPWWIGVIMFVIGTFLPVIPIMVNASKTYGASYISSTTYGYEQGLVSCGVQLKAASYSFKVEDNMLIERVGEEVQSQTWVEQDGVSKDETPIAHYSTVREGVTERSFNLYYTDRPYSGSGKTVKSLIKTIESTKYVIGEDRLFNEETDDKKLVYVPSYLILYKTGMYSKIYKTSTATAAATTYTGLDWNHADFTELLDRLLTVEGFEAPVLEDINYVSGALANWKKISNDSYLNQKTKTFWFNSGLYYGIYLALGLFMGFMLWLLTRGKNNPNRNLTIFIGFKISWWIDFTPGLLAMILGFVWAQAAGLGYIVLIGLRTMWLAMRQLNPTAQAQ